MTDQTLALVIIFGGLLLFAAVVGIYDLMARRQQRRERQHGRRSA